MIQADVVEKVDATVYFRNVFPITRAAYNVEEYDRAGQATDDRQ
jgi:hypothetical protein